MPGLLYGIKHLNALVLNALTGRTNPLKRLWHLKILRIFLLLKLQEWQNIINESKFDDVKTEY
jgi:hypothetical protein